MSIVRRPLRRCALMTLGLVALAGLAWSQPATYPARPVTLVVGSSPGSTSDGLARAIGTEWARLTGQPLVVDNKAGAFGGIAAQAVARAAPDGYTLFITTNTTQAANPHLYKKLPYDPLRDFAPVAQLIQGNMLMVVHPSVKANTVAEFIALARKSPGQLNYSSGSSSARIAVEQFQAMTGVRLNHVPYKANPLAVMDLVAGQVDMMIVDLTTSLPQVKAGKLRALGVSSPSRSRLVPEVPTLAESGLPGYEAHHWNALYAPAKTPQPVVARINDLLRQAMAAPAVRQFVEQTGNEVAFGSASDLARFQQAEYEAWGRVIKQAGIEPE
ncbi:Bug family tripartite tricarboxylate transporter substrate binding protein [Curvibacter gracilis]|uniref:Bug family tripartite tricarboxylate transporter substrate binding protein n=1 Tax=Curvibacter gracilis TaxID=230310 RepID=UPI0004B36D87|nr:tripartite tricarboxylate transporter substrate binding protein [Curvibacter gracilis]